ncbi:unnamed protein product [Larinioides sclopetarius]|uniref:Uncharacterized protein n=1 Tax=Larinioides sclopetarius TaxID=280406 RepID=A0AAV1Z8U0_9ARAC
MIFPYLLLCTVARLQKSLEAKKVNRLNHVIKRSIYYSVNLHTVHIIRWYLFTPLCVCVLTKCVVNRLS